MLSIFKGITEKSHTHREARGLRRFIACVSHQPAGWLELPLLCAGSVRGSEYSVQQASWLILFFFSLFLSKNGYSQTDTD
jgi:hypothetical protein